MSELTANPQVEKAEDVNLDEFLSEDSYLEDELEGSDEFDPVLSQMTPEELKTLEKFRKLQMEQDEVIQAFKQLETKPSEDEIENMKSMTGGDVYLVSFSEKENFIFRPLKRLEWRTLMDRIEKLPPLKKSESIVMKGVLWPKLNQQNINVLTAGAVETMKELVLQASNFMPPEVAMGLVRKL